MTSNDETKCEECGTAILCDPIPLTAAGFPCCSEECARALLDELEDWDDEDEEGDAYEGCRCLGCCADLGIEYDEDED